MKNLLLAFFLLLNLHSYANDNLSAGEEAYKKGHYFFNKEPADYKKARDAYEEGCLHQYSQGCFFAGLIYFNGAKNLGTNPSEAKTFFEKSLKLGFIDSAFYLGELYFFGEGVEKDLDKAIKYYQIVSAQPNHKLYADSNYNLAEAYTAKTPPDYRQAIEPYKKSCLKNHKDSCFNLGFYYSHGQFDGTKNYLEAKKWYEKADSLGSVKAASSLGYMYREGLGVTKDNDKAIKMYTKAFEQDSAIAAYNLGSIYLAFEDYKKTQYYFEKALELGITTKEADIQNMLATIYLMILPQPNKTQIGLNYWKNNIYKHRSGKSAFALAVYNTNIENTYQTTDYVQGLKYHYIAKELGEPNSVEYIPALESKMTPKQISEAKQLADEYMKQLNIKDTP